MMNSENTPIDKEVKIMLLKVLKKGYFSTGDLNLLRAKIGFEPMLIEVIDSRDKVDHEEDTY
ncbi:hypothetical protein [Parabacteroides sp. PF5-9]|uniref:hypothetical protein n=1 Tax=Parabacteroides sp. PF5-9 TaxID=1742404 RepID=UPI002477046E|nr:hypothetical protein [Parabacteroides sp. PF5-9]MDH6356960.1 hypothetical protein [Parabacteroides sp. PF5-9]